MPGRTSAAAISSEEAEAETFALSLSRASSQYVFRADSPTTFTGSELVTAVDIRLATRPGSGQNYCICAKWGTTDNILLFDLQESGGSWFFRGITSTNPAGAIRSFVQWEYPTLAADTTYSLELTTDLSQTGALNKWSLTVNEVEPAGKTAIDDDAITAFQGTSAENFAIGARSNAVNFFNGRIDSFRQWSDLAKTTLIHSYDFEEVLTDGSGNGRTLTGVNSPTFGAGL